MKKPLACTFGNHMHWVDMQWLWGYDVLPGCVADMLHFCEETGAKGGVNFDAVGYEKMAAECPKALADLRDAVARGTVEPVGGSWGQPYGLFHGGESNVRQFTYGVRATRRLLGVRPRTFWEEEFYFFPQLPQILTSCGYTGANLFFQWTWHTPEVPREDANLILWEGADATRIRTLPRNTLNVHQWPEDFDGLLEQGLINDLDHPAIVQWLELMPSRDWMCRSEVLLPRMKELFADERFDLTPMTCAEMIDAFTTDDLPVRAYTMDEVWHGLTLGKNADRHPRISRDCERTILQAEGLASVASLFGRPYASWDVYPTWELDEAWRELLMAQHHDNHECEGLCGFIGYHAMFKSVLIAGEVLERTSTHLFRRTGSTPASSPRGWPVTIEVDETDTIVQVPPFGYAPIEFGTPVPRNATLRQDDETWTLRKGSIEVDVDVQRGLVTQIRSPSHPGGVLEAPLLEQRFGDLDGSEAFEYAGAEWSESDQAIELRRFAPLQSYTYARISIAHDESAVLVQLLVDWDDVRPDPGFAGAVRMAFSMKDRLASIRADTPYAVSKVEGGGAVSRKYPEGDWMTSPQWFEHVEGSIVAHSFVDLLDEGGSGLLICHDGSQQWFRTDDGVDVVLDAYCPWDEERYDVGLATTTFAIVPHGTIDDVDRVRTARSCFLEHHDGNWTPPVGGGDPTDAPSIPTTFGALEVTNADNVLAHAFHRDSMKSGEHLDDWAGHRMFAESNGDCTHPFVIRLVEWNGDDAEVVLKLPGDIALVAKTNLMGECGSWPAGDAPDDAPPSLRDTGWLTPSPTTPPDWARDAALGDDPVTWSEVRFHMRPREIATIMADLVMGRKQVRDLDAKREVWATIHRTDDDARDNPRSDA